MPSDDISKSVMTKSWGYVGTVDPNQLFRLLDQDPDLKTKRTP